jgi:hypothetical protein
MTVMRAQPSMPMGDTTVVALRRLRQRWLAPSPPLAVDDEPLWSPAPDPEGEPPSIEDLEYDLDTEFPVVAPDHALSRDV